MNQEDISHIKVAWLCLWLQMRVMGSLLSASDKITMFETNIGVVLMNQDMGCSLSRKGGLHIINVSAHEVV